MAPHRLFAPRQERARDSTFERRAGQFGIEIGWARAFASCYGVNLAGSWARGGRAEEWRPLEAMAILRIPIVKANPENLDR